MTAMDWIGWSFVAVITFLAVVYVISQVNRW